MPPDGKLAPKAKVCFNDEGLYIVKFNEVGASFPTGE
jgi:hypothetical protein